MQFRWFFVFKTYLFLKDGSCAVIAHLSSSDSTPGAARHSRVRIPAATSGVRSTHFDHPHPRRQGVYLGIFRSRRPSIEVVAFGQPLGSLVGTSRMWKTNNPGWRPSGQFQRMDPATRVRGTKKKNIYTYMIFFLGAILVAIAVTPRPSDEVTALNQAAQLFHETDPGTGSDYSTERVEPFEVGRQLREYTEVYSPDAKGWCAQSGSVLVRL